MPAPSLMLAITEAPASSDSMARPSSSSRTMDLKSTNGLTTASDSFEPKMRQGSLVSSPADEGLMEWQSIILAFQITP